MSRQRETCYARHLRGFVKPDGKLRGQTFMRWGVINTRTGQIITTDNTCCSHERAMREADRLVAAARIAWIHGYNLRELA